MRNLKIPSRVIRHERCPSCAAKGEDVSEDNLAIYDDGHKYCFKEDLYFPSNEVKKFEVTGFTYEFVPFRGINKETLVKYDVKTKVDSEGKPVARGFVWPNGATQVKSVDKKEMWWAKGVGLPDPEPGLFGMDKFSSGENKYVIITEGAEDACSLYQVLSGTPVVSVQSASSAVRDCSMGRSFLNGFERIYLALDGDTVGREAADNVAKLFDPIKLYQLKFDKYKDANEYLQHGEEAELRNIWYNARRYQPENIVSAFQDFEKILLEEPRKGIPYPFDALNRMTYGIRTGETVLITAQEGIGKTELMHAIEYRILKECNDNVGAIFLEEPKRRHLQAIAGLEVERPVHLPDSCYSNSEVYSFLQKAVGADDRLHVYSHFGSDNPDHILDTVRFLVVARGCRYILFDHITMAVSGSAGDDERRALDYLSTRLEMLVKELDFALILVSHVNDDGKTRGSRNISKVADIRIDAVRDTINPDPVIRNTTTLTVSKNRFSGKTGPACELFFDTDTYTFKELGNAEQWEPANDNSPAGDARRAA